ncbi:luciferin 4-monooxygenase-like isoform X2 [Neocloeon triangulifer]|nr:luciferin 4-monooxygenase-like isoform X2 [Neocloeon triangulifer]
MAELFLVKIGVWLLGGVVRGCYQGEIADVYAKQIKESSAKFILVDSDTINVIHTALEFLHSDVCLISLGKEPIPGTSHISKLLADDGSAFKKPKNINVKEDIVAILNTSGSTGYPKGVVHTHYSCVGFITNLGFIRTESTLLEFMINYGVGVFGLAMYFLTTGKTIYHINKFDRSQYFQQIFTYKPKSILFYPFVANWFARCENELEVLGSRNIFNLIMIGGWVLDSKTADKLHDTLPNTHIQQVYGMTEIHFATCTKNGEKPEKLERCVSEGQEFTSSGRFLPRYEGKIMDLSTGKELGPLEVGELYVRSPCIMRGYFKPGNQVDSPIDKDGWLPTGDLGFMDLKGNVYIKDRAIFTYKYMAVFVLPTEIEAALQEHPDVQEAGVVGMPDPATNSASRALVVLKPGRKCSAKELCKFVADRLPPHKQLHGGVQFVKRLPVNKGGKLDRKALKDLAISEG